MKFTKKIEYVHGSYRGYLNGISATAIFDTKEEAQEQLNYLENILNKYDEDIIKQLFSIERKRIQEFFNDPKELIHVLDIRQYPEKRKSYFDNIKKNINEHISFKSFLNYC
jgi:hypothetical protein